MLLGRLDLPEADWWEPSIAQSGDLLATTTTSDDSGDLIIYRRAPDSATGWALDSAVEGEYRSVAVSGAEIIGAGAGQLDLLQRGGDGWAIQASVTVPDAGLGFGSVLAADDDRIVVVQRHGGVGGTCVLAVFRRVAPSFELETTLDTGLRRCNGLVMRGDDLIAAGSSPGGDLPQLITYRFDGTTWNPADAWTVEGLSSLPVPVALAGDRLVVGRPDVSLSALTGAVDVYERTAGGVWSLATTLTGTAEGVLPDFARFGSAVAVAPSGAILVASHALWTTCPSDPTCVVQRRDARLYAFRLDHGEWTETARWIGPGDGLGPGLPAGMLAYSIAVDGDRIIATAPFAPEPGLRVFALLPDSLEIPALSPAAAASLLLLLACFGMRMITRRR